MKKKINRRALFVFLIVTLSYSFLAFDFSSRIKVKREALDGEVLFQSIGAVETRREKKDPGKDVSFFMPEVLVFAAIKDGQLDEDCLILVNRDGNISWKKPLEIVRDRDREGLRSLSRIMGKTYLLEFFQKEGIKVPEVKDAEAIFLESDHLVGEEKIAQLYKKYVPALSQEKVSLKDESERKHSTLFEGMVGENSQWVMPDLRGYPMKQAVHVLNAHTRNIRIVGFGEVVDQKPDPNEKLKGEVECILRGSAN